ncbi:unnamed protein product, partial [Aphanomyces euteiches]
MSNVLIDIRVCSHCIPGPNEADNKTRLSALNKTQQDGVSVLSGSSNPSFVKKSQLLENLSRWTEPVTLSSYSGDDMDRSM